MKLFNKRPWNGVKTRKKMLFLSIGMAFFGMIIGCISTWCDHTLDTELTSQWFEYAKWLCGGSLCLPLAEIVTESVKSKKGKDKKSQPEVVDDEVVEE